MNSSLSNEVGHLIVIEGGDGLGKSTQVSILKNKLEAQGKAIKEYDFPKKSGTPIGRLIGKFLTGGFGDVAPEFLSLAFAADRFSQRDNILEDLRKGSIVICDRYVLSNIAFQTSKLANTDSQNELEELLLWLEYGEFSLPKPDLEIVLTSSDRYYREGLHLVRSEDPTRTYLSGTADIHEGSLDLQRAVNKFFSELPEGLKRKKLQIEDAQGARKSIAAISDAIWEEAVRVIR
tara:strand:- start:3061 stop:3762 length:702 start_codon:yes stop_codon:yes gene_type:complete